MFMNTDSTKEKAVGFLLLRLFFGQFWLFQFFGKIFDQESHIIAWGNLAVWSRHTTDWFVNQTPLPAWFVAPYTSLLPYGELLIGLLILIGLETRKVLIFSALLLISLDAGLLMQLKHDVVALNTIYLLALIQALQWEKYNRWTLDGFLSSNHSLQPPAGGTKTPRPDRNEDGCFDEGRLVTRPATNPPKALSRLKIPPVLLGTDSLEALREERADRWA